MGQKTHPLGFRIGVTEDWRSRWFAPKSAYGQFLVEDEKIRRQIARYFQPNIGKLTSGRGGAKEGQNPMIAGIEIERTRDQVRIIIKSGRPAMIYGNKGGEDALKEMIEDLIDRNVTVQVVEIKQPAISAQLIAEGICEQLRKRASFRRVVKARAEEAMAAGVKGIKIMLSGRLGGAELSRQEKCVLGSVPLATLQAHIDYGFAEVITPQGSLGCKVWVYKGYYGDEVVDETMAGSDRRRTMRRGKRA